MKHLCPAMTSDAPALAANGDNAYMGPLRVGGFGFWLRGLGSFIGSVLMCISVSGCRPDAAAPPTQENLSPRPFLYMPPNGRGNLPALLSQTGAFTDLAALKPSERL